MIVNLDPLLVKMFQDLSKRFGENKVKSSNSSSIRIIVVFHLWGTIWFTDRHPNMQGAGWEATRLSPPTFLVSTREWNLKSKNSSGRDEEEEHNDTETREY